MELALVGKVQLDRVSLDETLAWIAATVESQKKSAEPKPRSIQIATVNAQFVQIAHSNTRFASVLREADLRVADGVPLIWACRLLGRPLPGRVNGTDLMERLCELAAKEAFSVYLMGGRPGAAKAAADRLCASFPGLCIAGTDCPPMGFTEDAVLDEQAASRIRQAKPDILFVGLGAPKQEYWIHDHLDLPAKVMLGVGGSFELIAGMTKRAPLLLQRLGLEWLWRLAVEPRRLWKRYLVGNTIFVLVVLRQYFTEWRHPIQRRAVVEEKGKMAK
jgi:N-acetylglucosaminyldiphosphoundecaprenol N-acetyl-beta-D-mannosaminyltransferase